MSNVAIKTETNLEHYYLTLKYLESKLKTP